ncbi:MAG TPA: substrate-binding domain-containing protein [Terriglobales bacterium]|nr:substrate-binding domain-containing protein [Terriglobales bacterium]
MMKKLNIFVSLSTNTNDFQVELAESARATAERLGVAIQISYAQNDPIAQSQELLKVIQSPTSHPDAILFHPFGSTALPQVARAAVAAGIGVAVLNWRADYVAELRGKGVPVFICSSNHREIGRLQAQQSTVLLPEGGTVLYIQGPSASHGAQERAIGMNEYKPLNIQTKIIKSAAWTEEGGHRAVASWLRLSTAQTEPIQLVVAQNDLMAIGARKAFGEIPNEVDRDRWLNLPFTGVDGLPKTGQAWVRQGLLAATIVVPPNAGLALEAMVKALRGGPQPPECVLTEPKSYPAIEQLKARRAS